MNLPTWRFRCFSGILLIYAIMSALEHGPEALNLVGMALHAFGNRALHDFMLSVNADTGIASSVWPTRSPSHGLLQIPEAFSRSRIQSFGANLIDLAVLNCGNRPRPDQVLRFQSLSACCCLCCSACHRKTLHPLPPAQKTRLRRSRQQFTDGEAGTIRISARCQAPDTTAWK